MKRQVPSHLKVNVTHFRRYLTLDGYKYISDIPLSPLDEMLPQGGITEVVLTDERRREIIGGAIAYCSERDNFCKRIGRDIATGRILKKLEDEQRQDLGEARWVDPYLKVSSQS